MPTEERRLVLVPSGIGLRIRHVLYRRISFSQLLEITYVHYSTTFNSITSRELTLCSIILEASPPSISAIP